SLDSRPGQHAELATPGLFSPGDLPGYSRYVQTARATLFHWPDPQATEGSHEYASALRGSWFAPFPAWRLLLPVKPPAAGDPRLLAMPLPAWHLRISVRAKMLVVGPGCQTGRAADTAVAFA